jgi:hypothetical protein
VVFLLLAIFCLLISGGFSMLGFITYQTSQHNGNIYFTTCLNNAALDCTQLDWVYFASIGGITLLIGLVCLAVFIILHRKNHSLN